MKSLSLNIRNLLFSSRCILCSGKSQDDYRYLCRECYKKLEKNICLRNEGNLYYIFDYSSDIKKLMTNLKHQNRRYLCEIFGNLGGKYLKEIIKYEGVDLVIPVPINIKRKRERGFNQVQDILDFLGIPYETAERIKNTRPMHELLDEGQRKENIKNSFECKINVDKKIILLVDDIVTTGSTIRELVESLRTCGNPEKILVFTFAAARTAVYNKVSF